MTLTQRILTIAIVVLGTVLTRFLPFLVFNGKRETPAVISYLGRVLPYAVMAMLVVYCLKNVSWLAMPHGVPELLAILAVVLFHRWKGNVLLSIAGGTALYMLLVQVAFA